MPSVSIQKITTNREVMERRNKLPPVHPGEIIREDILPSVGLSVTAAAKALGVSRQMLHDILAARKPLSAVMCLKLSIILFECKLCSLHCQLNSCLSSGFRSWRSRRDAPP